MRSARRCDVGSTCGRWARPLRDLNGMRRVGPVGCRGIKRLFRDRHDAVDNDVDPSVDYARRGSTATRHSSPLRQVYQQAGDWSTNIVRNRDVDKLTQQHVLNSYLWHIGIMQRVADVPTWLGGYEKARAGGNDEARSVALADQAVIDSQGSGLLKDLSQIQRGGPLAKLFMMFYTYGATVFNETSDIVGAFKENPRSLSSLTTLLGHLTLLYLAPAMASIALANASQARR